MRSRPEHSLDHRKIVEESALPFAPMAMPEQTLIRPRTAFFLPFLSWFVSK